ncbi:MAG TPA: GFA family protein [Candidatus Didemnitutus sp.]|jgi:hypothetical protein
MTSSRDPGVAVPGGARILRGQCRCGAIRYTVADEFRYALNCHCSDCRLATGSAFKPFAGIARGKMLFAAPPDGFLVVGHPPGNHDLRCRACGSLLASILQDETMAHVTLGTLVDAPTIRPTAHILVADKAPWFTITDSLPQHPGLP